MFPLSETQSKSEVGRIVQRLRARGVQLWPDEGRLRFRASRGVLGQDDVDRLHDHKHQIVDLLVNTPRALANRALTSGSGRIPLAYSQLAHWHLNRLSSEPSYRGIAAALRLCGRLQVDVLSKSIAAVVRRHDALRTRIVIHNSSFSQAVASPGADWALEVEDVSALPS